MNDSFESDERKRKETIECLYWSLMNGWDIPKDIREHYGFSEDYELYHRLESMEPEDYRERRLRGEIPDAVEVDVRLNTTRLCMSGRTSTILSNIIRMSFTIQLLLGFID